jgi:thiol:disulfide interchange protein DsbC
MNKILRAAKASLSRVTLAAVLVSMTAATAVADEAAIRKNLPERMPGLPKIDEVSKTPVAGIYEVRMGTDIIYADETGNYVFEGSIYDTRTRADLTKARVDKLTAIDFAKLPLKDAMVLKQGNGKRKLALFVDPNCGYCKHLEKELVGVKDVTIYFFLYPILGADSVAKSRDIWCAKDNAHVWRNWMVDGVTPPKSMGACDTGALTRNVAMGRKYKVTGTPALVFEDGTRVPGMLPADELEKYLSDHKS